VDRESSVTTQFGKVVRESNICVLCGERPATTKEHIPPAALFITLPLEYLLVPACGRCNGSTKLDDEHLLQVMTAASPGGHGMDVWKTKVAPKLKKRPKTRAGLRNRLVTLPTYVEPWGTLSLPGMLVERARIHTSVRKLVFGLYWFHTGNLLPQDAQISVRMVNVAELPAHFDDPERMRLFQQTRRGVYKDPEVMNTFFYHAAISGTSSLWYFFFYKQNVLIALAEEPEQKMDCHVTT